jgi:hypothetical protein
VILTPTDVAGKMRCTTRRDVESMNFAELLPFFGQQAVALRAELGLPMATELSEASFVYFMASPRAIKIGRSAQPRKRLRALQRFNAEPLELLGVLPGREKVELALHKRFSKLRIAGEWFRDCNELRDFIWLYCRDVTLEVYETIYARNA